MQQKIVHPFYLLHCSQRLTYVALALNSASTVPNMAPTRPMPQGLPAVTSSQDVQAGSESGQTEIANNMDTVKTSDNEDQDELDVARMAEEMMKCVSPS